jgi:hypothetical protein
MPSLALDLEHLTAPDIAQCGSALQAIGVGAPHRQAVAERIVTFLYDSLRVAATGEPGCILARCFQTCPYARLPLHYQHAADDLLELAASYPNLRCLSLLATRGQRHVWNNVATSINHQSIPLPSVEVVKRAPMIARLLEQIGVPIETIVAPPDASGFLLADTPGSFNVFHVASAPGSPFIPAQQQFVEPYGVRSVLGMGGLLPDGELFVVILFTRVEVSREVAELFPALAGSVKLALLPFTADRTFQRLNS